MRGRGSPTPKTAGLWTAIATAVKQTPAGDLHLDLAIRNDTGDWSAMTVGSSGAVTLTTQDGKASPCGTAFVGTSGTSLAPGFQMRGYTGGTKAKTETQLLYFGCSGAVPAAGSKLAISYTYVSGEFNYYSPAPPASARLEVDLDKPVADLTYPVAQPVDGLVQKASDPMEAINNCVLTLTAASRIGTGWSSPGTRRTRRPTRPTSTPGRRRSSARTGSSMASTRARTLPTRRSRPACETAEWTTAVTIPKDVTGLYILLSVEAKAQKNFVSHAVDITDK